MRHCYDTITINRIVLSTQIYIYTIQYYGLINSHGLNHLRKCSWSAFPRIRINYQYIQLDTVINQKYEIITIRHFLIIL